MDTLDAEEFEDVEVEIDDDVPNPKYYRYYYATEPIPDQYMSVIKSFIWPPSYQPPLEVTDWYVSASPEGYGVIYRAWCHLIVEVKILKDLIIKGPN